MTIEGFTESQLRELFYSNLEVREEPIKEHITNFLMRFSRTKSIAHEVELDNIEFLSSEEIDTVVMLRMFRQRNYHGLIKLGDAYLFMLGWFPEWTCKQRKASLGIGFYVDKGSAAYAYAVDLRNYGYVTDTAVSPTLVSRMVDSYTDNISAIINLRSRIGNENPILDMELFHELKRTIGYDGPSPQITVIPMPVLNRRNYDDVHGSGALFDKADLTDIPLDDFNRMSLEEVQKAVVRKKEVPYLRLVKND